jgi:beta-glucosidase/6-phospho-beta-glucosidase/beta-galactosidase
VIEPKGPSSNLFASFFMGGFECATHGRRDGKRIDVIAATGHDRLCAEDYALLASLGVRTVRDGLRWHLIETSPGVYDWSSFLPLLLAASSTGTQVVWDLCHWGVPEGLSPFSPEFVPRFAQFAAAAARIICRHTQAAGSVRPNFYCPVNEISFWAWVGGDEEHFHPYGSGRGPELKRQLVAASIAAIRAVREADPTARFLQAEPVIHISAAPDKPEDEEAAARHTESQHEAWDMLLGVSDPELGGSAAALDLIGVNYYWNNQWVHEGERTPPGHELHRPLHEMLERLWQRYRRPILIAETGSEGAVAAGWLGYICAEVRQAIRRGVPVLGICLYPVMDYQGWDDDRHCPVGLIEVEPGWSKRALRQDLAAELRAQQTLFECVQYSSL